MRRVGLRFGLSDARMTSLVGTPELCDRIGTWWMNQHMADVKFNVGPPEGYIYTDRAFVTVQLACNLLYLAKKYLLGGLLGQVVEYLKENVGSDFAAVYREAVLHEELRGVCADFIARYPNDIFLSDAFVELNFDEMCNVAVKSLAVYTPTFYRKMLGWAQEECQRRSVEASTTNMRCALADAFKLIRFVELSPEEFEQGPVNDALLTVHEKAVLRHWYEHGDFRSLADQETLATFNSFAAAPEFLQGVEGVCAIAERQAIEDAIANRFIEFEASEVFTLEFETDKCVFFSSVVCSFRAWEVQFTLSVDGRTLATSEPLGCDYERLYTFDSRHRVHNGWSAALQLDSPVLVQAHRKYELSVKANDAVGTETPRITQIIGQEPHGSEPHDGEPAHFTLTYGDTRCVFAEVLYRCVDDTVYDV